MTSSRPTAPAQGAPRPASSAPAGGASTGRLVGLDLARGLAIIGMFVAHLGADGPGGARNPEWFVVADGRSASLFALLAGVSLALGSGRERVPSGPRLAHARLTTLVRAAILLPLGWFLTALGTPVAVILHAYAVLFLLAMPFLGLRRRRLLTGAAVTAVVGPTLMALLVMPVAGAPSLVSRLAGAPATGTVRLPGDELVTGYYPAVVFLAYVLVGLAVGRSDLTRLRTQVGLLGAGGGLAALAWGTSRLALDAVGPGASPLVRQLLSGKAHDDATLEVLGNTGTAMAVIGLFLLLTRPGTPGRVVAAALGPLAAAGAMSLSVYTVQIVAIFVMGDQVVRDVTSNAVLAWFVVLFLAGAWLWRRLVGRGPLERALHGAATAVAGPRPV